MGKGIVPHQFKRGFILVPQAQANGLYILCNFVFTGILGQQVALFILHAWLPAGRRNFVQILRSGAVARKSLGSRPKRLVRIASVLTVLGIGSFVTLMIRRERRQRLVTESSAASGSGSTPAPPSGA